MASDLLALFGLVCLVAGVALYSLPAGLIVLGVALLAAAWRLELSSERTGADRSAD